MKKIKENEKDEFNAINSYYEVIQNECLYERQKNQSFENRCNIIITIMSIVVIFVLEKVKFSDLILLCQKQLTFLQLLKIISGFMVYISFLMVFLNIYRLISVKGMKNFEVKNIGEKLLNETELVGKKRIILAYRDIIIWHRDINEKKAKALKISLLFMMVFIAAMLIFINF